MNFRPQILTILAVFAAAAPRPALAWGPKVHRIVCTAAWDEISEANRDRAREILNITAREQFAAHCVRPDDLINKSPDTAAWHVMNVARGESTVDLERDCPMPASCVVREIERNIGILESEASKDEKASALAFLGHLVADVHQPLNMGLAEDRGGEKTTAIFLGQSTTMRAIWDDHLLAAVPEPTAPNGILRIYGFLFRVGARSNSWTETRPLGWAQQSLWVMRTPATGYLGNPGGLAFDEIYVKQNELTALEQVDKAAVRLAHVLRDLLK